MEEGCRPSLLLLLLPLLLPLLMPAALGKTTCTYTDWCAGPNCTGCATDELIPDPENCRGYYVCTGSDAPDLLGPFDCADGEIFNDTSQSCEPGVSCDECPSQQTSCVYECPSDTSPKELSKISSRTDCNTYYVCNGDTITLTQTCDLSKPYFDGNNCQTDPSRCCHCKPYCDGTAEPGDLVPDPLDCRRYYTCLAKDTFPEHFTNCPDGQYFDEITSKCSDKVSCVTQCTNVIGVDGCIDPFTCVAPGYQAKCPNDCTPDYYYCSAATGDFVEPSSCSSGVFHPTSHSCVSSDKCP